MLFGMAEWQLCQPVSHRICVEVYISLLCTRSAPLLQGCGLTWRTNSETTAQICGERPPWFQINPNMFKSLEGFWAKDDKDDKDDKDVILTFDNRLTLDLLGFT